MNVMESLGSDMRPHENPQDREFSEASLLQLEWAESFCLVIPEGERDQAILKEFEERAAWYRSRILQNKVQRQKVLALYRESKEGAFNYLEEMYPGAGVFH